MNKQIIFVDSSVQDYQSLINNADAAQITNALANQKDISALHILSHGSEGSLNLSTEALNSHNLEKFSPQIKQWGKALTQNADILLYGCEVAKGETGQNFLKRLSEITEANIAASATPTGSTELGGDWKLEVQTGDIKATIPFNAKALNTYIGVLGFASKADFTTGTNPLLRQHRRPQRRRQTGLSNGEQRQQHRLHPAQHHRHQSHHPHFRHQS